MIVDNIRMFNLNKDSRVSEIIDMLSRDMSKYLKCNVCNEKGREGNITVSPASLNVAYKKIFNSRGYSSFRPYSFCEIDFYKDRVGVEVQFGKYNYVVYDIFSKFRPCYRDNIIDFGIEIVPSKSLQKNMACGVASFESEVARLEKCDVDFPMVVLGLNMNSESLFLRDGKEQRQNNLEEFFA